MSPIPVAIIGCGSIARIGHAPAFQWAERNGLCRLVGVCDLDAALAQSLADACGVPAFTSTETLLEKARPEVVSISTPPFAHRDLSLMALEAGCHVLCDKPVAMNLDEAKDMVRAAARADRLLSICFQYRDWDESAFLRERIVDGDLGHIHSVRTWGGETHGFRPVPWRYKVATAAGGIIAHWTVHNIDLVLWLLGHPEPLTATTFAHQRMRHNPHALGPSFGAIDPDAVEPGIEDFATSLVRLEGDTVLTVESDRLQPPSPRPEGWEILGSHGAASLSPFRLWLDRDGEWIDQTPSPGTLAPCDYDMRRLMERFLLAVRDGGSAPVAAAEILRLQATVDAIYRSAREGREVEVEPGRLV